MRLVLAIRMFFHVLFDRNFAERVQQLRAAQGETSSAGEVAAKPGREPPPAAPPSSARSDAISLLATLQREARFVDIVMEPLSGYSDAQIGAASRDVLRDCGQVLQRLFDLYPVVDQEDGSEYETPAKVDAGRIRLAGNVSGDPPYRGSVVHHGWQAKRCELPQWSGSKDTRLVVSPAELEIT